MSTNTELIARLRHGYPSKERLEAADAIEALESKLKSAEDLRQYYSDYCNLTAAKCDALQAQLAAAQGQIYEGNDVKVAMAIQNTTEVNKLKAKLLEAETESNDYRKSAMNLLTEVNALQAKLAAPIPQQVAESVICKGPNCSAKNGVGHSERCIAEHDAASLDTAGNRHPEFRYAGYKGQPLKAGASQDQSNAYAEGVRAAAPQPKDMK